MKPGAITLLTSTLVERGLTFVGKIDGDHKTVATSLPVVNLNPRDINRLATKLANRAFEAIKGSKLVFTTPRVERGSVLIDIAPAKESGKGKKSKDEVSAGDPVEPTKPEHVETDAFPAEAAPVETAQAEKTGDFRSFWRAKE
jgi:hypothetical protein